MNVIDLTPEHHHSYFNCLSEWSEEMPEAGDHKACWYSKYKDKGLRVKLVLDENVIFPRIDSSDRDVFLEWGISDGIFINGKQIAFGPPLSYEKIMKKIARQVKKLSH